MNSFTRRRGNSFIGILRWVSLIMVFLAAVIFVYQLVSFSRIRNTLPIGMEIANVPVGGLDTSEAGERLTKAYGIPVEFHYKDAVIQVKPSVLGYELNLSAMLAAADMERVNQPFWIAFWDYLWNEIPDATEIPLSADISEDRMRQYLEEEIASRYDKVPVSAMPIPGSVEFNSGVPGTLLDVDKAIILIQDALKSSSSRIVNLSYSEIAPSKPGFENLKTMMEQIIAVSGFDGIVEVYVSDLNSGQEINFAYQTGEELAPNISFTAASTIKIPIMISVFRRLDEPAPEYLIEQMELMIERSENDPADLLMDEVIEENLGPLTVTSDLRELGYQNTFLAGHFYIGAPLLYRYETEANTRTDVSTDPDIYNQTTPIEISMLMEDLYQCAELGGGALMAVFDGEVSQNECQSMVSYLLKNKIGVLTQAGLPDGTHYAHKHGWITSFDGLIHTIGDTGIVYSSGGDFIITIFMYHPVQLVWDPANHLFAQLGTVVYNYFNQTQ